MARPKLNKIARAKLSHSASFALTEKQYLEFCVCSEHDGVSFATWIRELAKREVKEMRRDNPGLFEEIDKEDVNVYTGSSDAVPAGSNAGD